MDDDANDIDLDLLLKELAEETKEALSFESEAVKDRNIIVHILKD